MIKIWYLPLLAITLLTISCASEDPADSEGENYTEVQVAEIPPDVPQVDVEKIKNMKPDTVFTDAEKVDFYGENNARTGSVIITKDKISFSLKEGAEKHEFDWVEPIHHKNELVYILPFMRGENEGTLHLIIRNNRCANPITQKVYGKSFIANFDPFPFEGCGGEEILDKSSDAPAAPTEGGGEPLGVEIK